MSDTGPAELAALVEDERKFRTYMVLSQSRLENKLDTHISDDSRQFAELSSKVGGVSSSVAGFEDLKKQGLGIKQVIIGTLAFIGGLGGFILAVIQIAKAWKSP